MSNFYAVSESLDSNENVCNTFAFAFGSEEARDEWTEMPMGEPNELGGHWRRRAISDDEADRIVELIGCTRMAGADYTDAMFRADEREWEDEERDFYGEDW